MIRKYDLKLDTLDDFMNALVVLADCHTASTLEINAREGVALHGMISQAVADGPTRERLTAELHDAQAAIVEISGPAVPVGVFDTTGDLIRAVGEMKRVEFQDLSAAHGEAISRLRSLEAKFNELNVNIDELQKQRDEWRDKTNDLNFKVFDLQTKLDTAGIEANAKLESRIAEIARADMAKFFDPRV